MLPRLGMPGRLDGESCAGRWSGFWPRSAGKSELPLEATVGSLSTGQLQLVEIPKALAVKVDIIIFDEPTSPLSPSEVERLFSVMRDLAGRGRGLIFVSHRLEEMFAISEESR